MHQRRGEETASQVFQSKRSYSSWEKIALAFLSLSPFQENRCVRFAWSYPPAPCWEKQMKTALLYILLLYPCTSGILNFFLTWHSSLFHFFPFYSLKTFWLPIQTPEEKRKIKAEGVLYLKMGHTLDFYCCQTPRKGKIPGKRPQHNAEKHHHITVIRVQSPEGDTFKREHHLPFPVAGLTTIFTSKAVQGFSKVHCCISIFCICRPA